MIARVSLWGSTIGAVSLQEEGKFASFEYDSKFQRSGIQLSPIHMPLGAQIYEFPNLARKTFHGLPGLLADSLPDKFGNALIDAWLATQGRSPESFTAVDRLCYTGKRGMGALEFTPVLGPKPRKASKIRVDALLHLASEVLRNRSELLGAFDGIGKKKALQDILRVGTSAGGARAKAVIAWNSATQEVRSGQINAGEGFDYWLLKFDGVSGNKDKELLDAKGYGAIEYTYYLMAKSAGLEMSECRLLEEGGRRHFMTKRFDRQAGGTKLHMQSLCGLGHFDFNMPGAYSYEQALNMIRRLGLPIEAVEQQYRRMVFNIVARNQDDHVKNIAFLMNQKGEWSLSPAFDVMYSYNPTGDWTSQHQMTANGKRDRFTIKDLEAVAKVGIMKTGRAQAILQEVVAAVERWPQFAEDVGIPKVQISKIKNAHRLAIIK